IEERPLDASEYVRALAAADDREDKTLREFLSAAVQERSPSPVPLPPKAVSRVSRVPQPAFGFKPPPSPAADRKEIAPMPRSRRLSLRALMTVIERHSGGREAGQLDIYRVFVRVDTALLKRNGIETLKFTEDRLVSDPELEQAIVRSVKKTLGLDCPD